MNGDGWIGRERDEEGGGAVFGENTLCFFSSKKKNLFYTFVFPTWP